MLREERNADFVVEGLWWWRRHTFCAGRLEGGALGGRRHALLAAAQEHEPVCVLEDRGRRWWWYRDRFFSEADDLSPADVVALVADRDRRRARTLERAHAALHATTAPRRDPIPRSVRLAVWNRDGGRCAECGATFDLQYDHVIPHSLGGAATAQNLQLLCGECNRIKGAGL